MTTKEAINCIKTFRACQELYANINEAMDMAIDALKSAPVWTSCSDGLPDDGKPCYITVVRTDKDGSEHWYVVEGYFAKGDWFDKHGWKIDSKGVYSWDTTAVAWRLNTVPEPYNPDHIVDPNKKVDPNKAQEA